MEEEREAGPAASGPRGVEVEKRDNPPPHSKHASAAPDPWHKDAREQVRGALALHALV